MTHKVVKLGAAIGVAVTAATALFFYYKDSGVSSQFNKSKYDAFLKLHFHDFDQSDNGWRLIDEQGKHKEAAQLIDAYLERHQGDLSFSAINMLKFHAGQCYAYAGDYSTAIERMEFSRVMYPKLEWCSREAFKDDKETYEETRIMYEKMFDKSWIPYVTATIAFLNNDRKRFNEAQRILDENQNLYLEDGNGEKTLLNVVNGKVLRDLQKGFDLGLSYLEAFTRDISQDKVQKPGLTKAKA